MLAHEKQHSMLTKQYSLEIPCVHPPPSPPPHSVHRCATFGSAVLLYVYPERLGCAGRSAACELPAFDLHRSHRFFHVSQS